MLRDAARKAPWLARRLMPSGQPIPQERYAVAPGPLRFAPEVLRERRPGQWRAEGIKILGYGRAAEPPDHTPNPNWRLIQRLFAERTHFDVVPGISSEGKKGDHVACLPGI